jgi:hypothetical protein
MILLFGAQGSNKPPLGRPSSRAQRAINIGKKTYRQITIYLLDRPDAIPQPREE